MEYRCRVCGNASSNQTHKAREMLFGWRDEFTYIECSQCGCLQLWDVPEDLSRYYPNEYCSFRTKPETWKPHPAWRRYVTRRLADHQIRRRNLVGRYAQKRFPHWAIPVWLKHADVGLNDSILDIGSGSGAMLLWFHDMGYRNLTGIDPYVERDMVYPNGVKIYKTDMEAFRGTYRFVLLHHVFEHLPEPEASLRLAASHLEPGCQMAIVIPVSRSAAWDKYGVNWVGLDPPRHLYLHNESTMRLLAERVGLNLEKWVYCSTSAQFFVSEGYVKGIPHSKQDPKKSFTAEELDNFEKVAADLDAQGRGDTACFFLRKP